MNKTVSRQYKNFSRKVLNLGKPNEQNQKQLRLLFQIFPLFIQTIHLLDEPVG